MKMARAIIMLFFLSVTVSFLFGMSATEPFFYVKNMTDLTLFIVKDEMDNILKTLDSFTEDDFVIDKYGRLNMMKIDWYYNGILIGTDMFKYNEREGRWRIQT